MITLERIRKHQIIWNNPGLTSERAQKFNKKPFRCFCVSNGFVEEVAIWSAGDPTDPYNQNLQVPYKLRDLYENRDEAEWAVTPWHLKVRAYIATFL